MFAGFLKFNNECEACGADFSNEDAGDGPAFFAMFAVCVFIVPIALGFSMATNAPMWLTLLIWGPVMIAACLYLLRLLRGAMFNIAWQRSARQVRNRDVSQ